MATFDTATPHIGPMHHPARTIFWILSLVAMTVLMLGYVRYEHAQATAAMDVFREFSTLYADRCDPAALSTRGAELRRDLYLGSPRLERTIAAQLAALEGGASCDAVWRALHAADFPLAAPPHREVRIAPGL